MASIPTILYVQGDDMPTITLHIRDKNTAADGMTLDSAEPSTWKPIDLTSCQVTAQIREKGGYVVDDIGAVVLDAPTGRIYLDVDSSAFFAQNPGNYETEITVTFPNGDKQTVYDFLPIKVRERFQKG